MLANDGNDGLRRWTVDRPDLIALDADLPTFRASSWSQRIREAERRGSHMPIVLMAQREDVDAKVRGLRAGADDYLASPSTRTSCRPAFAALLARFARAPSR